MKKYISEKEMNNMNRCALMYQECLRSHFIGKNNNVHNKLDGISFIR